MTANSGTVVICTVDMHTAGEPVRIVEGGYPELKGRPSSKSVATLWPASIICAGP